MKYLGLAYYTPAQFATMSPDDVQNLVSQCPPLDEKMRATGKVLVSASLITLMSPVRIATPLDFMQHVVLLARPASADDARTLTRELGDSLRKRYGLDVSTRSRRFTTREGSVDREWLYRRISVRLQLLGDQSVRLTYSAEAPTPTPARGL